MSIFYTATFLKALLDFLQNSDCFVVPPWHMTVIASKAKQSYEKVLQEV